jgi:flagellar biosynthetic protein FliR
MVIVPLLPDMPAVDSLSLATVLITLQQLVIGVLLGFSLQMLLQIFVIAGQIIAMNMGLGFASMVDPSNGISVPVVSQIYLIMVTLLFVVTNGHLVVIEVLVNSFTTIPVGHSLPTANIWQMLMWGSWMFTSALLLSLPLMTALLIVNITFGIMTRAAPQLNIFALGFPMSLLLGLFALWISVSGFLPQYDGLSEQAFLMLRDLTHD